jgi:Protein of unknown function (DUF2442)
VHWIKNAEYKKGYEIILEFENGDVKLVDLKNHLDKGILRELKDETRFSKFKLNRDTDTIEWETGADFSPDFLYEIGETLAHSSSAA